jgi:hypothetical protein
MTKVRQKRNIATVKLIDKNMIGKRKPRRKSTIPSILKKPIDQLTDEEYAIRQEKMKDFLPKMGNVKKTIVIDLTNNPEECKKHTESSCFRPDIYLDHGCSHCSLNKYCSCRLKNLKKRH